VLVEVRICNNAAARNTGLPLSVLFSHQEYWWLPGLQDRTPFKSRIINHHPVGHVARHVRLDLPQRSTVLPACDDVEVMASASCLCPVFT